MRRLLKITFLLTVGIIFLSACKTDNKQTKNLIIMVPDGASTTLLPVTRWYNFTQDSTQNSLYLDSLIVGMVRSYQTNAPVTASSAAMSAYMTGYLHTSSNISVYPKSYPDQDMFYVDTTKIYQPLVTVLEAAKLNKKSIGALTTVSFCHATPAAAIAHAPSRNSMDLIAYQMASQNMDVLMGSGIKHVDEHVQNTLNENGTSLYLNDIDGFRSHQDGKMWALWEEGEMIFEIDREPTKQPSIAEMSKKAIEILSKNKEGFCLLIEGGLVDYAAHANDPITLIKEFNAFNDAVAAVVDWAKKDGNTTVVIMPDHGTSLINFPRTSFPKKHQTRADSMFLDISKVKVSYKQMAEILALTPKNGIERVFKENTGIDLNSEELSNILKYFNVVEGDYIEVAASRNLQSEIAKIYLSKTNLYFSSSSHTIEDVFLGVYHPQGYTPTGIIRNIDLNKYMCEVLGLPKTLDEYTADNFVKHTELFSGAEFEIESHDSKVPTLFVKKDGKVLKSRAFDSYVEIDGQKVDIELPVVYIKETKAFYLPRKVEI